MVCFDKNIMCSVVFRGGTNVPTISGMFAQGALETGFHMELYCTTNRYKWHSVVIKWSVVISISGDLWCNIGIAQEV